MKKENKKKVNWSVLILKSTISPQADVFFEQLAYVGSFYKIVFWYVIYKLHTVLDCLVCQS